MLAKSFESNLKKLRNDRGLSLQQVADMVDPPISKDYLWRIEDGRDCPSVDRLISLANLYGHVRGKKDDVYFFFVSEGYWDEFAATIGNGNDDPNDIPDDETLYDLNDTEHIINTKYQTQDVIEATERVERSALAFRNGCPVSRSERVNYYKELFEAHWAISGHLANGQDEHPEIIADALARATEERQQKGVAA